MDNAQADKSPLDIYREVISGLDLSGKATELPGAVEKLHSGVDSLRKNIVSFRTVPAHLLSVWADTHNF